MGCATHSEKGAALGPSARLAVGCPCTARSAPHALSLTVLLQPYACLDSGVVKLVADGIKVTQQTPLKLRKECMEEEISFKCEVGGAPLNAVCARSSPRFVRIASLWPRPQRASSARLKRHPTLWPMPPLRR